MKVRKGYHSSLDALVQDIPGIIVMTPSLLGIHIKHSGWQKLLSRSFHSNHLISLACWVLLGGSEKSAAQATPSHMVGSPCDVEIREGTGLEMRRERKN